MKRRRFSWVSALIFVAGCGGSVPSSQRSDGSAGDSPDLSGPSELADLAEPPDLSRPNTVISHYVSATVTLPTSSGQYAADLIGDGKPRNQLGFVASTLIAVQNLDLQQQEDAAIAKGRGLFLFSLASIDPQLMNDPDLRVNVYAAQVAAPPDFSGGGKFVIDRKVPKGTLDGPLAKGAYVSADPMKLAEPPTVSLNIVLSDTIAVRLPVVGARLRFKPSPSGLAGGQLNGAVKKSDLDAILIPALAKLFTGIGQQMPCDPGSNCMSALMTFDKGPACRNPDGSMAKPGDHRIDPCEVAQNQLVQALLAPDVDLFDAQGAWHPNPANADQESLSLGVGFAGVRAVYTE